MTNPGMAPFPEGQDRQNGFTLLEMIIVVALLGLSLTLFLGYNFSQRERLQLKSSARELFTFFQAARGYALVQGQTNPCLFDPGNRTVSESLHGKVLALPEAVDLVLEEEAGEEPVTTTLTVFYPDGSARGGEVRLRGGGRSLSLIIDPFLGEVSIEEHAQEE